MGIVYSLHACEWYVEIMRILAGAIAVLFFGIPSIGYAAVPDPFTYSSRLIGMRQIPGTSYGTFNTAVRAGDTPTLQVYVHSNNGVPSVSADLSDFGLSNAATTSGQWMGYILQYYPAYFYNFGPLSIDASIPDGIHDISIIATSTTGGVHATTTSVVVDNTLPIAILSGITFSATPPQHGDTMYLSGSLDGTGTIAKASQVTVYLSGANGEPVTSPVLGGSAFGLDPKSINDALATSTSGLFSNVPIRLSTYGDPEFISRATNFTVELVIYDEAGNFDTTRLTVPVPKPLPPDPCAVPGACASNVLFLPGIEGSRLYRPDGQGADQKLWEPGLFDTLHDLYLTPEGKSDRSDVYTKTGDVIDEIPVTGVNIYKSFIAKMNDLRDTQHLINAWEASPYDWRLSLEDILTYGKQEGSRISYVDATSTPYIIQELKHLAASSKTHKVTIIAHSNGGLVAKALTEKLGSEAAMLIDKMIFVAVPQAGTPAAVAADMHGFGQSLGGGLVVSQSTARTFASTSPMAYNLLPSAQYFTHVDDPVVSFDASLPDWVARYGTTIHSQELLHTFLTDSYGRVDAQTGDINQPIQVNGGLLSSAEAMHASLDAWTPPAGVELIQIAGWGVPTTVSGITYKKKGTVASAEPNFTVDGDGTVVVPSALWTSTAASTTNYWIDLDSYNKRHPIVTLGGFRPFNHGSILETDTALNFVSDQIVSTTKPISDYIYLSTQTPAIADSSLRYALHSPLTLNLYDDQGRHTGVSTSTGQIEEQIPGTYYTEFGDVKYLFTDTSSSARIVMDGYAAGTFTFNVDQYDGDTLTVSTTFKDIPTTADTMVALDVQSDISTLSSMFIDKNGDGIVDASLAPKLGDIVTLDTTPPEIRAAFSTTTQSIAFVGTDDSGVVTVVATTTYPVLKKKQKQKEYHGTALTTVTARDGAGNTTSLVYTEQLPSPKGRDTITIKSFAYNGATTTVPSASLSYKWSIGKNSSYRVFAAHLRAVSTALESHYRPKKDTTNIMTKPRELDDSEDDDDSDMRPKKQTVPGMVIPYMATEKGSLIISY